MAACDFPTVSMNFVSQQVSAHTHARAVGSVSAHALEGPLLIQTQKSRVNLFAATKINRALTTIYFY